MKKNVLFVLVTLVLVSSCSTIFTGSTQNINITSEPSEANVVITNNNTNMKVFSGQTPYNVILNKGDGYFKGATYTVTVSKTGYKDVQIQITPHLTGWYVAGNFLVGGLIGWSIVDPITGGMWTLSPTSTVAEMKSNGMSNNITNKNSLIITMRSDINDEQFNSMSLVQIN